MSIKETKEQIAGRDDLWVNGDCDCGTFRLHSPDWSHISQGDTGSLFIHTKVWCPDEPIHKLIALADSHTALLEAIKQDYKMSVGVLGEGVASTAFALSNDAVKEAES
jgi:hypothetical protein